MKPVRKLCLILAACLLLSLGAFASGEASGKDDGASAADVNALVKVGADGTVVDSDASNYVQTAGTIADDGMYGVKLTSDDYCFNGVLVSGGTYTIQDCVLEKGVSEIPAAAGGVLAHVTDGLLLIRDSSLTCAGKGGILYADYPVENSDTGTLVVVDSQIAQTGFGGDPDGYTADVPDPPSNKALTISGYARASMSLGYGNTYYYGSQVTTEGWAAMSTDMGSVNFYAYNSTALAQRGGYGTYSDTSCKNYFYGCTLQGAEIGAIISNNGQIHLYSGADAGEDMFAGLAQAGLSTDDIEQTDARSSVIAGRNCVQLHSPEESRGASRVQTGVLEAVDTDFVTSAQVDAQADLVNWGEDYGPALGEYVDFVKGAIFLVKSQSADIRLTRCTADSSSGVLLMTAVNSDDMGVFVPAGTDMTGVGISLTLTDCQLSGDVDAYDYQRNCSVTLADGAVWTGAYRVWDKAQWDAAWSAACTADEACCWLLDDSYSDGAGRVCSLAVGADCVWNVTDASQLSRLTVEPGGTLNGAVTVDGTPVDVSAGGSWTGEIAVTPAEDADASLAVYELNGESYVSLQDLLDALGGADAGGTGAPESAEADYGYQGQVNEASASHEAVNLTSGESVLEDKVIFYTDGSAVQNSGDSVLVARGCYLQGSASAATAPLEGNPGNLLVAGSIRTTLALGQAHSFYLNSTIVSQNWAALSTDGAEPVTAAGQSELSLYAYGTEADTTEGGYGAYSDLFCNLFVYGSRIRSAEIGIISGTYGRVTIGTIGDGEANEELAARLTDADTALRSDKSLGSVVEGGRNALMIHSVNLPPYWAYEGYSQEELPLYVTEISASGSTLRTDLSLDGHVAYDAQKQAYIDHTAGSVVLIKSTNADLTLNGCALEADPDGTGAVIHTVYNNDTMFMNAVPDGAQYPGSTVRLTDMDVTGDVISEDYQRDLTLRLSGASLTGAVNYYDCANWNAEAAGEGFSDYALDASYKTVHGCYLDLADGSVWTVTAESTLLGLTLDDTSAVQGATMTVDGVETPLAAGSYAGVIVLTPAA